MSQLPELKWIAEARKYIGLKEIKGSRHNPIILSWLKKLKAWWNDDEHPWCGLFVGYCLQEANVPIPKHWYRALDYLNYGTRLIQPAYGCVAVKSRKGGGHVCFVVGQTKEGKLVCLGGNQNDSVSYALYDKEDFEAFMWYGKTDRPAQGRYNLPILSNITATSVSVS
jgi:uncharacterized protein (TIGR02594 family)